MQSYPINEYQIGIICALPKELKAVRATLDEEHQPLESNDRTDHNSYVLGRIYKHNVVAAGLPAGVYGVTSAASVARNMSRTFTQLRFVLLVGIAGGIPDIQANRDIRLGDVVVSYPDGTHGGVVQYDLGKLLGNGKFVRKGFLNKPPQILLTALTNLQAKLNNDAIAQCLEKVYKRHPFLLEEGYCYQGAHQDELHCARCNTSRWWWMFWVIVLWFWPLWRCQKCDNGKVIRLPRLNSKPVVHYGTIASGNKLLKNATERDQLARDLGALCVEMEAAGLDDCPCLVIRGICDFSDAYKNDVWQEYAALTAAAFAKVLLEVVSPETTRKEIQVRHALDQLDQHLQPQKDHNIKILEHSQQLDIRYHEDRYQECLRVFDITDYERQKNLNTEAEPGTCRWVLDHPQYCKWSTSTERDLLWISADPGCGKSVLSKSLIDHWLKSTVPTTTKQSPSRPYTICYFFFKDNEEQSSLSRALCAVLHQLFSHQPHLIHHAIPAFVKNREGNLTKRIDELWRILASAANDTSAQPIICVLDALDECCDADCKLLIDRLCQWYKNSTSSSNSQGNFKWLVTSRPYDDIQWYFGRLPPDLPSIRLRGEDENDQIGNEINLVIGRRMMEMGRQLGLTDMKREEVTLQLCEVDNRTYLWLHLVLENIEAVFRRSPRPNQVTIPSLPATVDQAYENILKRIVDIEKEYAKLVLTIIVGARRPLSIAEMALAFDIATLPNAPRSQADLTVDANDFGDKIRGWCSLFVFVKQNKVYLIHQTAKEFLLNPNDRTAPKADSWKHCLHPLEIDKEMAKICVFFLCLSDFDAASSKTEQRRDGLNTFFDFARFYWAEYVQIVEPELDVQIQSHIRALYDSKINRLRSQVVMVRKKRAPYLVKFINLPVMDGIQIAASNGHCLALQHIISKDPNKLNRTTSKNETALSSAVTMGQTAIVKMLLAQPGIDVNLGAPLSIACREGYKEIVELLLAQPGIDVNLERPLYRAAQRGHKEIVELLLAQPGIETASYYHLFSGIVSSSSSSSSSSSESESEGEEYY